MHIVQKKSEKRWDDGLTLRLFIEFLKKHHCLQNFYGYLSETVYEGGGGYFINLFSYPLSDSIGKLFIRYGKNHVEYQKNFNIPIKKDLVLSQLWKFYVLERLDEYPWDKRDRIKTYLKDQLETNGIRNDEELKQLFEKYNIKIRF